jgi:hypothetical protein
MSELVDFLTGDRSEITLDLLESRLTTWLIHAHDGISPVHALGFATAGAARRAVRDARLRSAAKLLPGSAWGRAETLSGAIISFQARKWPRWEQERTPPPAADEVDRLLFQARLLGPLPESARQLFNIIDL